MGVPESSILKSQTEGAASPSSGQSGSAARPASHTAAAPRVVEATAVLTAEHIAIIRDLYVKGVAPDSIAAFLKIRGVAREYVFYEISQLTQYTSRR
jgi:hypothetical protein